jgi:glycosidase
MKRFSFLIILVMLFFLSACSGEKDNDILDIAIPPDNYTSDPAAYIPLSTKLEGSEGYPWWNDTVFYEIFVRSFYDSDGNGVGDFQGLTEKLDYLNDGDPATTNDLGITGIWLMPINPSPSYHGYDVTDYYDINPDYGSMKDFKVFLEEAHNRGITVIIDLVINHTSTKHAWFQASTDPESEYREYYNWQETRPPIADWHKWNPTGDYYYGLFWEGMPDLNLRSEVVTEEIYQIAGFWLYEVGVDGFRLDAARHLIEDGSDFSNTPETHDWWKSFRTFYQEINSNAMMIGEIWDISANVIEYLEGDELDLAFNFDLASAYLRAAKNGVVTQLKTVISNDIDRYPSMQFGSFLTNHDQNRLMSQIKSEDKNKIAAALLLTGPGVPFLYYGEEIGMSGMKPDEDIRTAMQWSNQTNAGFTSGKPWRINDDYYGDISVSYQTDDPDSLLSWYRQLIHLRNDHIALRVGDTYIVDVDTDSKAIFSMLRTSDDETILVLINLAGAPIDSFSLGFDEDQLPDGSYRLVSLLDDTMASGFEVIDGTISGYVPVEALEAYQVLVFQIINE